MSGVTTMPRTTHPQARIGLVATIALLLALLATLPSLVAGERVRAATVGTNRVGVVCTTDAGGGANPSFTLTTRTGYILLPDGSNAYMWGYSEGTRPFQHPGPVLCVNEGDTVTIILKNTLKVPVSIVFPGQDGVLANGVAAQPQFDGGGVMTSLTNVAAPTNGTMTYRFTATHPGTFLYESGTDQKIQVRMGLFGALIVRPAAHTQPAGAATGGSTTTMIDTASVDFTQHPDLLGGTLARTLGGSCTIQAVATHTLTCAAAMTAGATWASGDAYTMDANPNAVYENGRADSAFDGRTEYLALLSEIDPYLNAAVYKQRTKSSITYNMNNYHPRYWLINGRGFPDSIADNFASWLPAQPYGSLALIHPHDERVLVNATPNPAYNPLPSIDRYLSVGTEDYPFHPHGNNGIVIARDGYPLEGPTGQDQSFDKFAVNVGPGQTWDVLFSWKDNEGYDPVTNPVPVTNPDIAGLEIGMFYSGSPYLGETQPMPPGIQTLNECGEFYIISHNHALYQITSWGVNMTGPITYSRIDPPLPNTCP